MILLQLHSMNRETIMKQTAMRPFCPFVSSSSVMVLPRLSRSVGSASKKAVLTIMARIVRCPIRNGIMARHVPTSGGVVMILRYGRNLNFGGNLSLVKMRLNSQKMTVMATAKPPIPTKSIK